MKINRELLKEKINIVDYIGKYVNLRKAGKNYVGLCPFHAEKTPSFTVSESKQIFYCFGCHAGGDVIEFLTRYLKTDYMDVLQMLEKDTGLKLFVRDREYEKKLEELAKIYELNKRALNFFINNLYKTQGGIRALEYLKKRKLSLDTMKNFNIGFGGTDWDRLYKELVRENYDKGLIEKCGLVVSTSGGVRDFFRNRIVFPILNVKGDVIAFGGRALDNSLPKYVNSQESKAFLKRNSLFGINIARKYIDDTKVVYLVEGYMDCIMMHQAGYPNTVATLGTAITEEHVKFLKPLADEFYLIYDGDEAGKKAAVRGLEIFLNLSINPYVVLLPDGEDPDSLIAQGKIDRLKEAISSAKKGIDFLINLYKIKYSLSTIDGQRAFIQQLNKHIENITNPLERELLIRAISKETGFTKDEIISFFSFKEKNGIILNKEVKNTPEDIITAILLKNPEFIIHVEDDILNSLSPKHLSVINKHVTGSKSEELSKEEENLYLRLSVSDNIIGEDMHKAFFDNILFLKQRFLRKCKEDITKKIEEAERLKDYDLARELLRQKNEIIIKEKEITKLRSS